jgi:hypothetical protein
VAIDFLWHLKWSFQTDVKREGRVLMFFLSNELVVPEVVLILHLKALPE